ncbi:MAG TPA: hypothetical protein VN767_09435 [Streptosporangiaceae bacterium]|nr:hypothetical protein [Streptosporangiaceae bacterium]
MKIAAFWAVQAMEDVISQGGERRPPSRRRRLAVAGALVAVAALVVAEHLPHSAHKASRHQQRPAAGRPRSVPVHVRVEGPATLPSGVVGPTVVWAATERLPLTGSRPAWFWPTKGRVRPIAGLPSDRYGYSFTRVGGGWAILPDEVGSASFGPAVPVFYLPTGSGRADMIGVADQVAPAETRHALWLINYPPHTSLTKAIGVAQEFTTNGLSMGRPVLLPAGHELLRGTKRGLLLAPVVPSAGGQSVRLWNPATSRFTARFYAVVAASADAVAYTAPASHWVGKHRQRGPRTTVRGGLCLSTCQVHVLNLATGYKLTLLVPPGHVVTDAAFSPDGRYLALEVSAGESSDSSSLEVQLEVASLATGHLTVLPHTWATGDPMTGLGWPGNDDGLVAKLDTGSKVQMAFWAPGARSLAVANLGANANPADIVVG